MAMHEETETLKKYGPYDGLRVLEIGAAHNVSKANREVTAGAQCHIGLDMQEHECVQLVHNLHEPLDIEPFDVVLLFSVLEHTPKPWVLAENVQRLLKVGGLLLVSCPFQWRVHNYPDDYFRYTPSGLRSLFPEIRVVEEFNHRGADLGKHQMDKIQIFMVGRKFIND